MSHSTHVGFSEPDCRASVAITASFNGRELRSNVACEAWPDFQSRAEGVGHIAADAASIRLPPFLLLRGVTRPPWLPSVDRGVGHSDLFTARPSSFPDGPLLLPSWLKPCGVGHNPDPISPVWRANGGSGNTVPLSIKAERSDFPEHLVQSARAKGGNVFDDDPLGVGFFDEAAVL